MDIREMAVQNWGFEDNRTVTICYLVEQGRVDLAERLFYTLMDEED